MDGESGFGKDKVIDNLDSFIEEHFMNVLGKHIKPTTYQSEFIRTVLERKKSKYIYIASTRIGKSEAVAMLAVLVAILFDSEEVCNIAPDARKAEHLFKRIKNYFENNSKLMAMVDRERAFRRDEISLKNGSVLRCLSANDVSTLLGFGATTLIVDEAASIPDEIYKTRVVRMIASSGAKKRQPILVLISTPHIMNHFYESWMSDDFVKFKTTWQEGVKAGILDKAVVDYSRSIMSEADFSMWFEARFMAGDKTLFDRRVVEQMMIAVKEDAPVAGYDYYMGLDIARLGLDESVIVILKMPSKIPFEDAYIQMVYVSCRAKRPINDIIGWVKDNVKKWNATGSLQGIGVDSIGLGASVEDLLREQFGDKVKGIRVMGQERIDVYMNLLQMIENKKLELLKMDKLLYQFGSFSIAYQSDGRKRISKNPKQQDDVVDSLAFSAWLLRQEKEEVIQLYLPMKNF